MLISSIYSLRSWWTSFIVSCQTYQRGFSPLTPSVLLNPSSKNLLSSFCTTQSLQGQVILIMSSFIGFLTTSRRTCYQATTLCSSPPSPPAPPSQPSQTAAKYSFLQNRPPKLREHKCQPMHLLIIIPTPSHQHPTLHRVLPIPPSLLGAHHEPDLAGGVSGCGGVRVLRDGEYPSSYLLELADEREVDSETLALGGVGPCWQ